ncbi:hypothetical protein [uncultured Megasphaera sp.]|nr:hypothetical protein [uncultured Megasphaera sp.]
MALRMKRNMRMKHLKPMEKGSFCTICFSWQTTPDPWPYGLSSNQDD